MKTTLYTIVELNVAKECSELETEPGARFRHCHKIYLTICLRTITRQKL